MAISVSLACGDRNVQIVSTDASDGDFAVNLTGSAFTEPRSAIHPAPWTWLRQEHGAKVVEATFAGEGAGSVADGAFTARGGCPVAVTTADCAPVVLVSTTGVAVVHAGWKGAMAGVIARGADLALAGGGEPAGSWLGPCIGSEAYEFGPRELEVLAQRFGGSVMSLTADGLPALDLTELVARACVEVGWPAPEPSRCTSDPRYFSHRKRQDLARQTTVAWIQ